MKKNIDRRRFIEQSVSALGALSSYPLMGKVFSGGIRQTRGAPRRIIIIGAGLAGLSAGYELSELGHEVIILEARARAGGRVFTIREPFSDGLYAEAGAQFVPETHDLTMKYVKLFNLPLIQLEPSGQRSIYYIRGKRLLVNQDEEADWPLELTREEKRLGVAGLMKRYVEPVLKEMGDATLAGWPPERLRKYDQMTMAEFLRIRGASPAAIELFRMGYLEINGEGIDSYSALSGLRDLVLGHAAKEYQIKGGSDLLPHAMAAKLADRILYGSPVVRIEHNEKAVKVTFLQAGSHQTLEADHVICAVPFSTLKLVEVVPGFSFGKQKAIERLSYTSVTRVYLQLRRKVWQVAGLSGEAYIDNPRMLLAPLGHSGGRDIYESFITGSPARQVMSMAADERLNYVLEQTGKVLPAVRENFEGGTSKSWDEDRWARGAWVWYQTGEMASVLPSISAAEGRVHFAGEHTSAWPGWMQGAFESGNRVAQEVHAAN